MDHFFVGMFTRRQVQFMAKSQLFRRPMQFIYSHGGVFPLRRGHRDEEAFLTAELLPTASVLRICLQGFVGLDRRRSAAGAASAFRLNAEWNA